VLNAFDRKNTMSEPPGRSDRQPVPERSESDMTTADPFEPPQPDVAAEPESEAIPPEPIAFEDLTLAQMFGQLRRAPRPTLRALVAVARTYDAPEHEIAAYQPAYVYAPASATGRAGAGPRARSLYPLRRRYGPICPAAVRFHRRVVGCGVLANSPNRGSGAGLREGAPYLLIGFLLWLVSETVPLWRRRRAPARGS